MSRSRGGKKSVAKLWTVIGKDDGIDGYAIECPGCGYHHCFYVRKAGEYRGGSEPFPIWPFNGDMERPTFQGSMLLRRENLVCHSFVRDERIEFLSDCTHKLTGQTVELSEVVN